MKDEQLLLLMGAFEKHHYVDKERHHIAMTYKQFLTLMYIEDRIGVRDLHLSSRKLEFEKSLHCKIQIRKDTYVKDYVCAPLNHNKNQIKNMSEPSRNYI